MIGGTERSAGSGNGHRSAPIDGPLVAWPGPNDIAGLDRRPTHRHLATRQAGQGLPESGSIGGWRRGWDSNPRYACTHNGFRDRPNRPLWHLSDRGRPYRGALPREQLKVVAGLEKAAKSLKIRVFRPLTWPRRCVYSALFRRVFRPAAPFRASPAPRVQVKS